MGILGNMHTLRMFGGMARIVAVLAIVLHGTAEEATVLERFLATLRPLLCMVDVGFSNRFQRNEHPAPLAMTPCLIPEQERDSFPVALARLRPPPLLALEPGPLWIPPLLCAERSLALERSRSFHADLRDPMQF